MNSLGSLDHRMMSTFSRPSSAETAWMRWPLCPMQAPMGSTLGLWLVTATLLRRPGSRAMALISTMPSAISGTSCLRRCSKSFSWARLTRREGPLADLSTFFR